MKYGYARASSNDQDTAIQVAALVDAGCEVIRTEKASGVSLNNREELTTLMEFLRPGDELVITRIDRLARSLRDLENLVYELDQKGVVLSATLVVHSIVPNISLSAPVLSATEQAIDTSTNEGRCFISMLGIFAQFEHSIRYERQMEGVKKAKAEGKYKGRKPSVPVALVKQLRAEGLGASAIAKQVGCSRASVYVALKS